jgi:hypothetical protein
MKNRLKIFLGILTIFVTLPLTYAGTILLYMHVDAPTVVWVLLFINLPINLFIQVGMKFVEDGVAK